MKEKLKDIRDKAAALVAELNALIAEGEQPEEKQQAPPGNPSPKPPGSGN